MHISDFLNTKIANYASYDNLRKICSYIDGLKNASRKVIYTVHEKKIKENIKVLQLANKAAEFSDYLHGDLSGVLVTLGQDFAGTNNMPLLEKSGNFGTRSAHDASAPRYIFAKGSEAFFKMFDYEDDAILEHQTFEGFKIEPRFYVPVLPICAINGSEGVSTGFAQKILGRNPKNVAKYIQQILSGKKGDSKLLIPWSKGFKGTIEKDPESLDEKFIIKGKLTQTGKTDFLISDVPWQYDLKGYLDVLDDLVDKKVIRRYEDLTDGENNFEFKVFTPRNSDITIDELFEKLKLSKSVTENLTCIDENNKIIIFKNIEELIKKFIEVKLKYTEKKRCFQIGKITDELAVLKSKYKFINLYIQGKLKLAKRSRSDIEKDLEAIPDIVKVDSGYSYLLGMPLYSLTEEKLRELEDKIKDSENKKNNLEKTTASEMYSEDLDGIIKALKL